MIPIIIIEGIKIFATTVLPKLWKKIVNWTIKTLKEAIIVGAIEGFKYFVKKLRGQFLQIIKEYDRQGSQWFVTEKTKIINEVPHEIEYGAVENREVDFSDELQEKLELIS